MEIESYDPYHIGIKLNNTILLPVFRQKLIKAMKNLEMEVTAPDQMPSNVTTEIITTEGDTRIEFNYKGFALNTIGNDPKQTSQFFSKLLKVLTTIGYELDSLAAFYEIVTNINIKSDINPTELINRTVNCNLESWKELGSDVNVNGLKIDLLDKEYGKEYMTILVGPNPVRPKSTLGINLRYQHLEDNKITEFSTKIEERVLKFVKSLGEKSG